MRSRYSAFAKHLESYLLHSWHPDTRPSSVGFDPLHRWTGLTVVATEAGGPGDDTGVVEFVASYEIKRPAGTRTDLAEHGELREVSEFVRLGADPASDSGAGADRRWVYVAERRS